MIETKAIVLAAGKGSRMKSDKTKVMHTVCAKELILWIVNALENIKCSEIIIIVNEENKAEIENLLGKRCTCIIQKDQLGTAHAVLSAQNHLKSFNGLTFVMVCDAPGIKPESLNRLKTEMQQNNLSGAFLVINCPENKPPWGRVIYKDGKPVKITEEKDANPDELKINTLSSSHFIFKNQIMLNALKQINNHNKQKEYYLSDIIEILAKDSDLKTIEINDLREVYGANTPEELVMLENYLADRHSEEKI